MCAHSGERTLRSHVHGSRLLNVSSYRAPLLVVAIALALSGCGHSGGGATESVVRPTVVLAVPKEGPEAHLGRDIERAAKMQFEATSKTGNLERLRLVVVDEASSQAPHIDPETVAERTQDQIDSGGVVGWVGGVDSDALAVELPRLNQAGVLAVSPNATATAFNRRDPGFPGAPIKYYPAFDRYGLSFARTSPTDIDVAGPCLKEIAGSGQRKVFTVDAGDTDGDSFSSAVDTLSLRQGITVVGHESVPLGHADWEGLVQQIHAAGAQVVIWGSTPGPGQADLWAAVARAGLRVQMVAGSVTPPSLISRLSHVVSGTVICSAAVPSDQQTSRSAKFAQAFTERWGHEPTAGALRGASAMAFALEALKSAKVSPAAGSDLSVLRSAATLQLSRTRRVDSLLGVVTLDRLGNWSAAPVGIWTLSGSTSAFKRLG